MKKLYTILGVVTIALIVGLLLKQSTEQPVGIIDQSHDDFLDNNVAAALDRALDDEYKALVTYQVTMNTFGEQKPFVNIAKAESRHIASLTALYQKYQLAIPENTWIGQITIPETFQEVCALGVQAEIENAKLYQEELIPMVEAYPDIMTVFESLKQASEQNHLPAFERCAV